MGDEYPATLVDGELASQSATDPHPPLADAKRVASLPNSSKQSAVTFLIQRLDRLIRQSGLGTQKGVVARLEVDKGELQAQRRRQSFEDASTGL